MTDLDLDSIRRRHDEDHEHDGGCDTLDLLAEVERLRAAATHEVAAQYGGEFDRWYAAERAKRQAEALRDAAYDATYLWSVKPAPGDWLRSRADRIERGE